MKLPHPHGTAISQERNEESYASKKADYSAKKPKTSSASRKASWSVVISAKRDFVAIFKDALCTPEIRRMDFSNWLSQ
jgi:hypothetical protein